MASDASDRHWNLALWVWQLLDFDDFHRNVPRANRFKVLLFGDDTNRVVALGLTRMGTVGGVVGEAADLLASWTIALMAVVWVRVMTFGMDSAWETALWGANFFLTTAGDFLGCSGASALDCGLLVTGITWAVMAERGALVLAAGERFSAHFVTRWTLAVAALSIARMFATAPYVLAL